MGWHSSAFGAVVGLRRGTTRAHFLRAVLDGIALRLRAVAQAVFPLALPNAVVVASGGALEDNTLWRQILADALGRPLVMEEASSDATAKGVGLLLRDALDRRSETDASVPTLVPATTLHPETASMVTYDEAGASQSKAYETLLGPSSTFNRWHPPPLPPGTRTAAEDAEAARIARHRSRTNAILSSARAASGLC